MKRDTTPHIAAVPGLHAAFAPACIVVLVGSELGRRVELGESEVTIGRDDDNTISVALDTISRHHARIFLRALEYTVEDLGSTNGTFINEQELAAPTPLRNGDLLRCGGAVFKFIEGGNIEALYHEEIYRLTITDGLTQVANRRHFRDFLEREIARALRHGRPLSLVMFDLDHFKSINDRYGHLAGDRVLQGITTLVSGHVRRDELLARYGGEEFAVVLPETNLEEAGIFCERIRYEIENATFDFDGQPLRATVSLGVAMLAASESMASLIARADAHLYEAKQKGRNRTCGA